MMNNRASGPRTLLRAIAGASVFTSLLCSTALSQSAQPGEVIELDPILISGSELTSDLAEGLREKIRQSPGAADVVGSTEIQAIPEPTVSQAMAGVPGVVIQEFFGGNDQPRFQVRGSGMQQNPTERGLMMLQNGMPVNRADGSYIAGFAAPGMAEAMEVWRGPSAHRLGAYVLGGAMNFISPTASTRPGTHLSFGLGSDGRIGASGSTAFQGERANGLLQFEHSESDGFRYSNNDSRRTAISGNVEIPHGQGNGATQVFLSYTDLEFGVPGPLPKASLQADPRRIHAGPQIVAGAPVNPGPNVPRDLPRREATQLLAGVRSTLDLGDHRLDFGISASDTEDSFRFPISAGERVTDGYDGNLSVRYAFRPDYVAELPLLEATMLYSTGEADRTYYHNTAGVRGAQFGANKLKATSLSVFLGANIPLSDTLYLSPSIAYTHATRDNDDLWAAATRPTVAYHPVTGARLPDGFVNAASNSYRRSYSGWNPKLALTWTPTHNQTAWISLSHSFEPPTHGDLLSTSGGTPNSGPGRPVPPALNPAVPMFNTPNLEAQEADTLEVGWRGQRNGFAWDVTAYHSKIKNEILSLRDVSGSPRGSVNADRTTHTGLEAGLIFDLMPKVTGRLAWTWQDFRFDGDPIRGNNQLGGTPKHYITASLAWQAADRLTMQGTVRWVPEKTPVDNMNTLFNDPYFVADLRANYKLTDRVSIVAEISNVFDENYAGSTLVVDRARADQAAFIPGEGRSFYIGTKLTF